MKGMLRVIADYIELIKAKIEFLEKENVRLKKLLEESDTKMAMIEIERLKRKNNMGVQLGTAVKGEEIIVFDGSAFNENVVTVVAEISNDKMYAIRLYNCDSKFTLEDIRTMCVAEGYKEGLITVIIENPFEGVMYEFGNYNDDMWHVHGNTQGYA